MQNFWLLLLGLTALTACQTNHPSQPSRFTLYSEILQEDREILLHLPQNAHLRPTSSSVKKYPVLLVLDGESLFPYVREVYKFLGSEKGQDLLPETVIVGIPNTNRDRDLTPYPVRFAPGSGGGRRFADFLEQELFPHLAEHYPVLDHRTIIGHSFGGLFALYTLQERSDLFDQYLAIDPSYWAYPQADLPTKPTDGQNKRLFLALANSLPLQTDTSQNTAWDLDIPKDDQHFRALSVLRERMNEPHNYPITFASKYYPREDHGTVCLPAIYDGLRALFDWFPIDEYASQMKFGSNLMSNDVRDYLASYTRLVRQEMGQEATPDDRLLRKIAWAAYGQDNALTREILHQNHQYHPHDFDANMALGLFYYREKQFDRAIDYLQKTLDIKQDPIAEDMLAKIRRRS